MNTYVCVHTRAPWPLACVQGSLPLPLSLSAPSLSLFIIPHFALISPLTVGNILLPVAERDFMLLVLNSEGR